MVLERLSVPGMLTDMSERGRAAWSRDLDRLMTSQIGRGPDFPGDTPRAQFFSALGVELAQDATVKTMRWGAFPRGLTRLPTPKRWHDAEDRNRQDEYCEWSATQDGRGRITRAFFTTEFGAYFHAFAHDNPDGLLELYRSSVSTEVELRDLIAPSGSYRAINRWNLAGAMHMIQQFNTLSAAVVLAAQASVVRERAGVTLTNAADLIECGVTANADRNSDPLIVGDVNALARRGAMVTLADPVGIYLGALRTEGWETPDGADAQSFWRVTRGTPEHPLRAEFAVPQEHGYTVTDITISGQPIVSPSQIAEALEVRLVGLAHRFGQSPVVPAPCRRSTRPGGPPEDDSFSLAGEQDFPSLEELIAAASRTR
jgi:hypothetical protein